MRAALEDYPVNKQPVMPDGMLTIRIDPKTGKLASIDQKDAIFEVFRAGHAPTDRAFTSEPVISPEEADSADSSVKTSAEDEELF